jgi:hypothetical protein
MTSDVEGEDEIRELRPGTAVRYRFPLPEIRLAGSVAPVDGDPARAARGRSRVVRGPVPQHHAAVPRRRRLAVFSVLVLLASLGVAILASAGSALARTGGGPLTATGGRAQGGVPAGRIWVVRPGDTLWGIATALEPARDVRPLVDRLAAEMGPGPLQPGELVTIPSG